MKNNNETTEKMRKLKASCNIYKDDEKVLLSLEMPGVSKENLDVRIDDDNLIIEAKKDISPEKGTYLLREIKTGDYYHEFTIDDTIDRNSIDASISNGVVTLVLKLKESVKPRRIEVKNG